MKNQTIVINETPNTQRPIFKLISAHDLLRNADLLNEARKAGVRISDEFIDELIPIIARP
ncbi:MAG: hypothetical protein ACXW1Z_19075 [Methylobacter sp.]